MTVGEKSQATDQDVSRQIISNWNARYSIDDIPPPGDEYADFTGDGDAD